MNPRKDKGPTVVVGGVQVSGPPQARKKPRIPPFLGLLALGGILLLGAFLASCAGSASLALRSDGSVALGVDAAIPGPLAAKLRKLASLSDTAPLFDVEAARKAAARHPKLRSFTIGAPGPDAYTARIEASSLASLLAEPELAQSGALGLATGPGWKELSFHLARGGVEPLLGLAPGLDRDLLEALSPPALDPEPISRAEYRTMLKGIIGEKALASLDSATCRITVEVPGRVLASAGGRLEGRTLTATLPLLDLMVLENPIDLRIRWASD